MTDHSLNLLNYDEAIRALDEAECRYRVLSEEIWKKGMDKKRRIMKSEADFLQLYIGLLNDRNEYTMLLKAWRNGLEAIGLIVRYLLFSWERKNPEEHLIHQMSRKYFAALNRDVSGLAPIERLAHEDTVAKEKELHLLRCSAIYGIDSAQNEADLVIRWLEAKQNFEEKQKEYRIAQDALFESLLSTQGSSSRLLGSVEWPHKYVIYELDGRQFMLNVHEGITGGKSVLEVGAQIKVIKIGSAE